MEPVGLTLSQLAVTPERAASATPRNESMDDIDSSSTRKRPRLDSGNRAYRSMSTDPTYLEDGSTRVAHVSPQGQRLTESSKGADEVLSNPVTPSKMTINVRESGTSTSPSRISTHDDASTSLRGGGFQQDETASFEPVTIGSNAISPSPNVVSIALSPPNSPEIEVAEIEDMTDDPGETKWKPLASRKVLTHIEKGRELETRLMCEFPHASASHDLKDTVQLIARAIEKSKGSFIVPGRFLNDCVDDFRDGKVLVELGTWIRLYLQDTEPYAPQWLEFAEDEREFWDEIPLLVECIARRRSVRVA